MVDSQKVDAAQRAPRGQEYKRGVKTGGVAYDPATGEVEEEQVYSKLTPDGKEIPDSVPMEPPIGYSTGPSLADFVHRMIHGELSKMAEDQEFDTFEEAEDF